MEISSILKKLRLQHDYKQTYVADILGIHYTTYGKYESGKVRLDIEDAKKLADLYNLSLDQFYNFGGYNYPEPAIVNEAEVNRIGKKTITVLVELDGSKKTEEHWHVLLKEINELLYKKLKLA
jgi:transcriptional regulator with XRE-family HTH domain